MRAQAVAQLAVRSARFSACAGFGSPSAFLLVLFALAISPQLEAAARRYRLDLAKQPLASAALLSCWGSRLRLFGDEAGDIGSEAIAMAAARPRKSLRRKSSCARSEG